MKTIAIDYDNTFTANPTFWKRFLVTCCLDDINVIVVTNRTEDHPIPKETEFSTGPEVPDHVPIIYAGPRFKMYAALERGYHVDVWIDDMPGTVQSSPYLTDQDDL